MTTDFPRIQNTALPQATVLPRHTGWSLGRDGSRRPNGEGGREAVQAGYPAGRQGGKGVRTLSRGQAPATAGQAGESRWRVRKGSSSSVRSRATGGDEGAAGEFVPGLWHKPTARSTPLRVGLAGPSLVCSEDSWGTRDESSTWEQVMVFQFQKEPESRIAD